MVGGSQFYTAFAGAKAGVNNGFGFVNEAFDLGTDVEAIGISALNTMDGLVTTVDNAIPQAALTANFDCISNGLNSIPNLNPLLGELDKLPVFKAAIPTSAYIQGQLQTLNASLGLLASLPQLSARVAIIGEVVQEMPTTSAINMIQQLDDAVTAMPVIADLKTSMNNLFNAIRAVPEPGTVNGHITDLQTSVPGMRATAGNLSADLVAVNTTLKVTLPTDVYPLAAPGGQLDDFSASVASMNSVLPALVTELNDYSNANAATMKTQLATLKTAIAQFPDTSLETGLDTLVTVKANTPSLIDRINSEISDFNSRAAALPTPLDALKNDMDTMASVKSSMPADITAMRGHVVSLQNAIALLPNMTALVEMLRGLNRTMHKVPDVNSTMTMLDDVEQAASINMTELIARLNVTVDAIANLPNTTVVRQTIAQAESLLGVFQCVQALLNMTKHVNDTLLELPPAVSQALAAADQLNSIVFPNFTDIKAQLDLIDTTVRTKMPDFAGMRDNVVNFDRNIKSAVSAVNFTQFKQSLTTLNDSLAVRHPARPSFIPPHPALLHPTSPSIPPSDAHLAAPSTSRLLPRAVLLQSVPDLAPLLANADTMKNATANLPDLGGLLATLDNLTAALASAPDFAGLSAKLQDIKNKLTLGDVSAIQTTLGNLKASVSGIPDPSPLKTAVTTLRAKMAPFASPSTAIDDMDAAITASPPPAAIPAGVSVHLTELTELRDAAAAAGAIPVTPIKDAINNVKAQADTVPSLDPVVASCDQLVANIDAMPDLESYKAAITSLGSKMTSVEPIDTAALDSIDASVTTIKSQNLPGLKASITALRDSIADLPPMSDLQNLLADASAKVSSIPSLDSVFGNLHYLDEAPAMIPDLSAIRAQIVTAQGTLAGPQVATAKGAVANAKNLIGNMLTMMHTSVGSVTTQLDQTFTGLKAQVATYRRLVNGYNDTIVTQYEPMAAQYLPAAIWGPIGILCLPIMAMIVALLGAFVCRKGCCIACGSCCTLWVLVLMWLLALIFHVVETPTFEVCSALYDPDLPAFIKPIINKVIPPIPLSLGSLSGPKLSDLELVTMGDAVLAPLAPAALSPQRVQGLATLLAAPLHVPAPQLTQMLTRPLGETHAQWAAALPGAANMDLMALLPNISLTISVGDILGYYLTCAGPSPLGQFWTLKDTLIGFARNFTDPAGLALLLQQLAGMAVVPKQGLIDALGSVDALIDSVDTLFGKVEGLTNCSRVNGVVFGAVDALCVTAVNAIILVWMGFFLTGCCLCPTLCCQFYGRPIWPKWDPKAERNYPRGWTGPRDGVAADAQQLPLGNEMRPIADNPPPMPTTIVISPAPAPEQPIPGAYPGSQPYPGYPPTAYPAQPYYGEPTALEVPQTAPLAISPAASQDYYPAPPAPAGYGGSTYAPGGY
ncbi:hypothetical protein PAPYR_757 [Paratrimastix pyriformis]|uniref:Uncharacterized protein n=1 Tax=Paratrimastix pyriformis TaxID=342808 RepID=A0ABQ8UYV0_9EUKA|nr:hypothetical protein PAPYR_757 [Paratrimastix pyriformis]